MAIAGFVVTVAEMLVVHGGSGYGGGGSRVGTRGGDTAPGNARGGAAAPGGASTVSVI